MGVRAALARVRYRGMFLAALGAFDLFYGLFLLLGGQLQFPLQVPAVVWGWAWAGTGMFLIFGAFTRRDGVFFAAAVFIKTAWALEFVRLAFTADVAQWPQAAHWACLAAVVIAASAWPEPPAVTTPAGTE